jgi:hypothetical protein
VVGTYGRAYVHTPLNGKQTKLPACPRTRFLKMIAPSTICFAGCWNAEATRALRSKKPQELATELNASSVEFWVIDVSTTIGADRAIALARIHPNFKILALVGGSLDGNAIPGRFAIASQAIGIA